MSGGSMEYVTNFMNASINPVEWAKRREDQGWHILSVADHFYTPGHPFPHSWVTAGALAAATSQVRITTAFTNNLFRNPVEVAQAALMMQQVSNGRFELGLGAGWAKPEMEDAGMVYPEARDRAGAFVESAQIIRSLIHTGTCEFAGHYYKVNVNDLGPVSDRPPPLVASVGGPRTVREVTPHCDRVEIKASSASTRGGVLDLKVMAQIDDQHLVDMIERVRSVSPDIGIGMFVLCNAVDDDRTKAMQEILGDSLYSRFYGSPQKLAEGLAWLGELGITRCQISPLNDHTLDALAPVLFK